MLRLVWVTSFHPFRSKHLQLNIEDQSIYSEPAGTFSPSFNGTNATMTFSISSLMESCHNVFPFSLSLSTASLTVLGIHLQRHSHSSSFSITLVQQVILSECVGRSIASLLLSWERPLVLKVPIAFKEAEPLWKKSSSSHFGASNRGKSKNVGGDRTPY